MTFWARNCNRFPTLVSSKKSNGNHEKSKVWLFWSNFAWSFWIFRRPWDSLKENKGCFNWVCLWIRTIVTFDTILDGCCSYQVSIYVKNGQKHGLSPRDYWTRIQNLGLMERKLVYVKVSQVASDLINPPSLSHALLSPLVENVGQLLSCKICIGLPLILFFLGLF